MTGTEWTNEIIAGELPMIFHADDPRPAREQIEARYVYGGGYRPFSGFMDFKPEAPASIAYPGDPLYVEVSRAHLPLTDETLILMDKARVVIILQASGYWEAVRLD